MRPWNNVSRILLHLDGVLLRRRRRLDDVPRGGPCTRVFCWLLFAFAVTRESACLVKGAEEAAVRRLDGEGTVFEVRAAVFVVDGD